MTRITKKKDKSPGTEIYGWTLISVCKVPTGLECARVKNRPMNIIASVLAQKFGVLVNYGERMISLMIPPGTPLGDPAVFREEVLGYVSIYDTYSLEEDEDCAKRIIAKAEQRGLEDSIGYGIFIDLIEKSYMEEYGYDIWTV